MDLKKEQALEQKYTDVLSHFTLKNVLKGCGDIPSRSVGSAIKAYCKDEKTRVPDNFCDAEVFASNVYEHWEESKPGFHKCHNYDDVVKAIKRYMAFKFIWKAKTNSNTTLTPMLQLQASNMLVVKGAIGAALMAGHKHTKLDPNLRPGELAESMEIAFQTFIPILHKLQTKESIDDKKVEFIATELVRLLDSDDFKQIEHKPEVAE